MSNLATGSLNESQLGKTVVIVVDDSGSMNKSMGGENRTRMDIAKQAMQRLIETLPEETQLGIVLLNGVKSSKGWIVPLGPLDKRQALSKVSQLHADGGTPLGAVMQLAMNELLTLREQQSYGDYRLVVITDGEATDADLLKANLPQLVSKGVLLDVIGVDMKSDHSLVHRSHSYRRANDAASFEKALQEIFAESSFDANNADGDQGFELISALPDELAKEALVALRESGQASPSENDPSQNSGESSHGGAASNVASSHGQAPVGNSTTPPAEGSSNSGKLFIAFIVVVIILLFKGFAGKSKRR